MAAIEQQYIDGHHEKKRPVVIGSSPMLIDPLGLRCSIWDFVVTILLLSTLITMPLIIGWDEIADKLFSWNLFLDLVFFLDLLKNFNTVLCWGGGGATYRPTTTDPATSPI